MEVRLNPEKGPGVRIRRGEGVALMALLMGIGYPITETNGYLAQQILTLKGRQRAQELHAPRVIRDGLLRQQGYRESRQIGGSRSRNGNRRDPQGIY